MHNQIILFLIVISHYRLSFKISICETKLCIYTLHIYTTYLHYISTLHIYTTYLHYISTLHIYTTYLHYISTLHIYTTYLHYISTLHIYTTYLHYISTLQVTISHTISSSYYQLKHCKYRKPIVKQSSKINT